MNLNKNIFKDKKLSDIFQEIYNNQKEKKTQVKELILELKGLINNIGDATLLVPLIKDYLDIGVKNDNQLIQLANLICKLNENDELNGSITEKEKEELLKTIEDLKKDDNKS